MVWADLCLPGHCQSIDAGYSDFGRMLFCYKFVISNYCRLGRPKSLADEIKKEETSNIQKHLKHQCQSNQFIFVKS